MNSMLTNDERTMREKILPYEFPFDEKAWNELEALLDRDREPPLAGLPSRPPGPAPGPGRRKKVLALVLLVSGLCSATLLWWTTGRTGNPETDTDRSAHTPGAAAYSAPEAVPASKPAAQSFGAAVPERQNALFQRKPARLASREAPGPVPPNRPEIGHPGFDIEDAAAIASGGISDTPAEVSNAGLGTSDGRPAENGTARMGATKLLPLLFPIPASPRPDSIIRPVFELLNPSGRWERGWIFGLNANTVDYTPLRLSALPHLGYLLHYRWRPGISLQAEAVVKFVSGYRLHAEFLDILPGGSSHIVLHQNNLLFLEIPLLVKRAYAPGQAWQLGIKPALNWVIAPNGSTSGVNNAPGRYVSDHDGLRRLDLGLVAGWEWRFGRYWALDVRYNQGLYDLTIDNFYKNRAIHLNADLQVSLRHYSTNKIRRHAPKTHFPVPAGR